MALYSVLYNIYGGRRVEPNLEFVIFQSVFGRDELGCLWSGNDCRADTISLLISAVTLVDWLVDMLFSD